MRLFTIILTLLIIPTALHGQDDKPATPDPPALTAEQKKRETLTNILAQRSTHRQTISEKRKITQNKSLTDFERSEAAQEIANLQVKIDSLESKFSNLATGENLEELDLVVDQTINLNQELKEVLRPIIEEFRDITAAPREAEDLRSEIATLTNKIAILSKASNALKANITPSNPATLNEALESKLADLQQKKQGFETELGIAQTELAEREANTPTFFTSLSEMVQEFFRTRGAHLLLAILAAGIMVFILRLVYRSILKLTPDKVNRAENFTGRLLHLGYVILSAIGALIAFIVTLYLTNDWLLLALTILFLIGVAWAGKNTLPQYIEQAKMILNLGPVRHKERLIYQGVPWEVQKINFYTTLKNPALEGGHIRLPMRDLMPLHSRPLGPRELWFPTDEDDWVILTDGTTGKVIQQTPDYVHLVKLGGARKVIPTQDFLSLHPENISRNFRITVVFGIDYRHQKVAVSEVPAILKAVVHTALSETIAKEHFLSLQVYFSSASASSLDYRIIADLHGDLAPRMNTLRDFIQASCVEACNQNDWNIPFTQITVHQAETPAPVTKETESTPRLP